MWPNPQFPADLVIFTEKSLIENFIFCVVPYERAEWQSVSKSFMERLRFTTL